jgi:DNA-binding transcriptional ArsR family regulator
MIEANGACQHPKRTRVVEFNSRAMIRAAGMLRAAGDPERLKLLGLLVEGEMCVSEIAETTDDLLPTVSQRLKVLRQEGLVASRRDGKHMLYSLADQHVIDLIFAVLEHAQEPDGAAAGMETSTGGEWIVTNGHTHENHPHQHGPDCGHTAVQHDGHTDYLHDGHLHHQHGDHVHEHELANSSQNPSECTPEHDCGAHDGGHRHGPGCGHEAVPHDGHVDYLVDGHLHHPHGDHCDNHGQLATV